jgi:hypothetical protein
MAARPYRYLRIDELDRLFSESRDNESCLRAILTELDHRTAARATSFAADGTPQVVIDWKSDVAPAPETIEHYRAQVGNYLRTTGADHGLIVFVTTGTVVSVLAPGAQPGRAHLLRAS